MPCCDPAPYYKFDKPARSSKKNIERENKTIDNLRAKIDTLGKQYNELKKRADDVTQLLCYACGNLMEFHNLFDGNSLDPRLIKWWKDHNAWDKQRTLETFKKQFGSNPDQRPDETVAYEWFVKQANDVHPLSNYHKNVFFEEVWNEFVAWFDGRKSRAERIAELEAELARLKAEA